MSCDFIQLATEGVRALQPYQPGKPIEALQRELGLDDVVKLASNENPLGPGPKARQAIVGAVSDLGRYPDGSGFALKTQLSATLGVREQSLTLGNGSNDILDMVARGFAGPGSEIVYSEHAFAVYALATHAVGANPVVVPARRWGHDLAAMIAALTPRTRVVFVANPNNPTGTWLDESSLREFVKQVSPDVLIVIDEAYCEYVWEPDYPDCVPWPESQPNVVVSRTFSKVHGLAGLRVGYAVSHPDVADILNRVRHPFNVNTVALAAARAALLDADHVARSVDLNRSELVRLYGELTARGLSYIPSVGNFVAVDLGGPAAPVNDALLREGVIVRPIAGYGMPDHLRVTVGLPEENDRFLAALDKTLKR